MAKDERARLVAASPTSYSINPSGYEFSPLEEDSFPSHIAYDTETEEEGEDLLRRMQDPPPGDLYGSSVEEAESTSSSHFEPHARKPFVPPSDSAMASRMRYYNKLAAGAEDEDDRSSYQLPAHVVPSSLFFPSMASIMNLGKDESEPEDPKQSDIKLIFSIWNTMMGSSMLALPWGFSESGLGMGLFLIFILGALTCYTCVLIVRHGKDSADFFYLCNDYLGGWGKWLCWVSSIAVLLGGVIAYDILMADILYASVNSVTNVIKMWIDNPDYPVSATATHWWWNTYVTPLIVFAVMFPICNMRKFGIIVTINSLGVVSIMYSVLFIFLQCTVQQGLEFDGVPQLNSDCFVLAGLLSISFYIHGMILPIIKSAKNPQNNVRNVVIGYVLVGLSYSIVGAVGYLAYWNSPTVSEIPEEFLQIYDLLGESTNPGVIAANFLLLFQLATVFPLLLLIVRIQLYGLLMNSQYPGWQYVLGLNLLLMGGATMFALFYPNFGSILR